MQAFVVQEALLQVYDCDHILLLSLHLSHYPADLGCGREKRGSEKETRILGAGKLIKVYARILYTPQVYPNINSNPHLLIYAFPKPKPTAKAYVP